MSNTSIPEGRSEGVRSVAIAQPTFLSWMGWFDLADQVDLLIILDDVAFSKQSWQQRNRIRSPEGLSYLTVPVRTAGKLGQKISDTETDGAGFVEKMIRTISQNYRRAPFFESYFHVFSEVFRQAAASERLCELNCGLIDWFATCLGVATPRIRSSELGVGGRRGDHVAMLCERVGAARYVSPAGAEDYLIEDRAEFDTRGIEVQLHVFEHPVYRQCFQPFVPYASVLDLLLNEGAAAGGIIRSGRRAPRPLGAAQVSEGARLET